MKKILFLTHNYPENPEDLRGSFFIPLTSELLKKGYEIEIVCPKWNGKSHHYLEKGINGEKIYRFGTKLSSLSDINLLNPFDFWHFLLFFKNWLTSIKTIPHKWDFILIPWPIPSAILLWFKPLRSINSAVWWIGSDFNRFDKTLLRIVIKFFARLPKNNISNSQEMTRKLQDLSIDSKFVPLGLNFNEKNFIRSKNKVNYIPGEKLKILSVGRLDKIKGFDIAIDGIKDLLKEGFNVEYSIIGDGNQSKSLKKQCEGFNKEIKLLGYVSDYELHQIMRDQHILLISSRSEGMPLVFFEALNFGLFVLSSRVGDIEICLQNNNLGESFAIGDKKDMKKNISSFIKIGYKDDEEERFKILSSYSINESVNLIEDLMEVI